MLGIDNKLHNYLKITCILNNVFRPQKTLKKTRIKLYNTLALPVLLYGSETWTVKARDGRRITDKHHRRHPGIILFQHINVFPLLRNDAKYSYIRHYSSCVKRGISQKSNNCTLNYSYNHHCANYSL